MVEPTAGIRLLAPADHKEVRFIIGRAAMDPLAVANNRGKFISQISSGVVQITLRPFTNSLYASNNSQHMDPSFIYFHPVHELVARSARARVDRLP
jgi:hypothetical protein